jgi:hypothetical protein
MLSYKLGGQNQARKRRANLGGEELLIF